MWYAPLCYVLNALVIPKGIYLYAIRTKLNGESYLLLAFGSNRYLAISRETFYEHVNLFYLQLFFQVSAQYTRLDNCCG